MLRAEAKHEHEAGSHFTERVHSSEEYVAWLKSRASGFILVNSQEDDECNMCRRLLASQQIFRRFVPNFIEVCKTCFDAGVPEGI